MNTPPAPRRPRSRGFTLTELIIAIAIICVLAALLFRAFQAGRRSALATRGMSNLSQLAKAQLLYAQENGGVFTTQWTTDTSAIWQQRLYPYVGIDAPLWDIKTLNALRMDPNSVFNVPDSMPKNQRALGAASIGMNGHMALPQYEWNYRTMAIPEAMNIIMLGEMFPEKNAEGIGKAPATFNRGGRDKMMMALCDGHVEAFDLKELSSAAKDRPGLLNRWNWWEP